MVEKCPPLQAGPRFQKSARELVFLEGSIQNSESCESLGPFTYRARVYLQTTLLNRTREQGQVPFWREQNRLRQISITQK